MKGKFFPYVDFFFVLFLYKSKVNLKLLSWNDPDIDTLHVSVVLCEGRVNSWMDKSGLDKKIETILCVLDIKNLKSLIEFYWD